MVDRERLTERWNDLLTCGLGLTLDDPRRRRLVLLNVSLLAGGAIMLFFAPFDLLFTRYYVHAAAEFIGCIGFIGAFYYLRTTRDIENAALTAVLITMFVILAVVINGGTRDLVLIWITLFPLVAFFLLGAARGLLFTSIFFAIALFAIIDGMGHWPPVRMNGIALLNLTGTLLGLVVLVYHYEVSRAEAQRELEQAAHTDFLTGLPNRRRFQAQFEMELERADRHGLPLSLLVLDIDHFKRINDSHGHEVGDEVIRQLALLLLDNVRRNDTVARLGGEEFGVLLPHTSALQAGRVAEKLRIAVEQAAAHAGNASIPFTISIGVAENGPSRGNFSTLFAAADGRLYRAKQAGRNRVVAS